MSTNETVNVYVLAPLKNPPSGYACSTGGCARAPVAETSVGFKCADCISSGRVGSQEGEPYTERPGVFYSNGVRCLSLGYPRGYVRDPHEDDEP